MIDYYLDYCPRPYYLKEVLFTCLFGGFLTVSCHSERSEESDNVCFIFSADVYRFFTSFRMTETVGILTHLHHANQLYTTRFSDCSFSILLDVSWWTLSESYIHLHLQHMVGLVERIVIAEVVATL